MKQVLKLKSILSRIDFKIDFKGLKSILKSILRIDETPPWTKAQDNYPQN